MMRERVGGAGRPVLGGVDAIVNDMNPRRLDVEQAEHVLAGLPGDRDDRIRMLHRGPFHPGAEMVAVAELLDFPRAERLERMDAEHEQDIPEPAREQAAHVGVPGVAVDDVGIDRVLGHRQRALERVKHAGKARVGVLLGLGPGRVAADGEFGSSLRCSPKQRTSTAIRLASARLRYSTWTPAPP